MRRAVDILLLLLVLIWPAESALAATAMASAHSCCQPKAAATPSCREHGMHADLPAASARHQHDQCPMDCCAKRQASGAAAIGTAMQLRSVALTQQEVRVRACAAHASRSVDSHSERGPPLLA